MFKFFRNYLVLIVTTGLLLACSDSDAPQEKAATPVAEEKAVQLPAEVPAMPEAEVTEAESVVATEEAAVQLPADAEAAVSEVIEKAEDAIADVKAEVVAEAEAVVEEVAAVAGDKPYQITDGKISENAMNGWRTYNGGGCGTCHGKGGIGAVGPNLAMSVTKKLSEEQFKNIVTNGISGTMMRPHKTNKRVMDNIDDLYVYLLARGDDVLGPGNLIKMPLGK